MTSGRNRKDTGHRITSNAFARLSTYYKEKGLEYEDDRLAGFIFAELLPLATHAYDTWKQGDILKTDYSFRVGRYEHDKILWYVPNERNGITIMTPDDY